MPGEYIFVTKVVKQLGFERREVSMREALIDAAPIYQVDGFRLIHDEAVFWGSSREFTCNNG